MREKAPTLARIANGWQMNTDTMGVYGDFYLKRAIVAMAGLGANQPDDAIYPLNIADADGKPVTAQNKYVLHFSKEELPPVGAFWSLTMYDAEGFQVANPINRFAKGIATHSSSTVTVRWISTSRIRVLDPTRNPTGCLRRRVVA